jgi:hypothetical protein
MIKFFSVFPNNEHRWKTCPSDTLSITNPTRTDPGSNPGLRGERLSTNRLSHVKANRSIYSSINGLVAAITLTASVTRNVKLTVLRFFRVHCMSLSFITVHIYYLTKKGRAMAEEVSRRPLTAEARVPYQVSRRGICGGQSGTGTGCSPSYCGFFFPISIIPPVHAY